MIKSEDLGKKISVLCIQQDIKQKELAEKVGVTKESMSRYVRGKHIPKLNTLKKIAKALKTTPEYLMDYESNEDSEKVYYRVRRMVICNSKNWTMEQKVDLINTILMNE